MQQQQPGQGSATLWPCDHPALTSNPTDTLHAACSLTSTASSTLLDLAVTLAALLVLLKRLPRKNSGWRGTPMPVLVTCSRYLRYAWWQGNLELQARHLTVRHVHHLPKARSTTAILESMGAASPRVAHHQCRTCKKGRTRSKHMSALVCMVSHLLTRPAPGRRPPPPQR